MEEPFKPPGGRMLDADAQVWLCRRNIANFRAQLARADGTDRSMLSHLLAEEEAKLRVVMASGPRLPPV